MSHNRPANNVRFLGAFLDWAWNNRIAPILAGATNFVLFLVQSFFGALAGLIIQSVFLYVIPWLILLLYYWKWVWKLDFHVKSWYGIFREQNTLHNLMISTNTVSSLWLEVNIGPAVGSWTFRFSVPKDCILVDCHRPSSWKKTFSSKEGITCFSSMRSESTFPLKFDLQARTYSSSVIQCRVNLEVASNTRETGIPSNTTECKNLQVQKNFVFSAQMIPP